MRIVIALYVIAKFLYSKMKQTHYTLFNFKLLNLYEFASFLSAKISQ